MMATEAGVEMRATMDPGMPMAAMRRGGPAPVDLVHLARQTFGSADLEREVLRLFVQQGAGLVARVVGADTVAERADAAHRLKGSARAIGANRVGRVAEDLETATDVAEIAALGRDLAAAVGEVERFIAEILAPRA